MNRTSMPGSDGPSRVEVARLTLHVPTGDVAVQGVVRGPGDAPVISAGGNPAAAVAEGGSVTLRPGDTAATAEAYEIGVGPVTVEDALALAEAAGWQAVTRAEMADLLDMLAYRLPSARDIPGKVEVPLTAHERDDTLWHPSPTTATESVTLHCLHLFVTRAVRL
jgi:hypothetical protein